MAQIIADCKSPFYRLRKRSSAPAGIDFGSSWLAAQVIYKLPPIAYVPDMKLPRLLVIALATYSAIGAQGAQEASTGDDSVMAMEYGRFFEEMTVKVQAIDTELMQAQTPKAAAIGVVRFTYTMRDMRDRAEALDKKYPLAKGEMPPKLKIKSEAFGEATKHLGQNGMQRAATKYADTPEMKFALGQLREFASGEKKPQQK